MRLFHLITSLDTGGAESSLATLVGLLKERGFVQHVASLIPPGPVAARIAALGVPVGTLAMRRGIPTPWALARLVRMIRAFRPQVVQTWLYHADLIGLAAVRLAGLNPGKVLAWNIRCSEMDLSRYGLSTRVTLGLLRRLSGLPAAVVTNSARAKRLHLDLGYASGRFPVIPNGVDAERYHPDPAAREAVRQGLDIAPDTLVVGHAARFDPMKDHAGFLRAAGQVAAAHPGAVFALCGRGVDGANPEIAAGVAANGLAGRVRLLGERADLPRVMASFDLFVSSSLGEGFPNVLAEAMACGVPCVATDVGDSAYLLGPGGLVAPPGDPAALSRAMGNLLSRPQEERSLMGRKGRERVRREFSLERMAAAYAALYRELAGG